MKYTIIGGKGFIGAELATYLVSQGYDCWIPERDDERVFSTDLGIIVYCAGHGDCIKNPLKVIDSNLSYLAKIIEKSNFAKIVYLSSTRLYLNGTNSAEESDLKIDSNDQRRLFNLSKIAAEELCLKSKKDSIIVRLSNVYGLALNSPLFLPAITRDAIKKKVVDMYVSPQYAKDYVSVIDVAELIHKLTLQESISGEIFNVASGINTTALEIAETLVKKTGTKINWHEITAKEDHFPVTDISKIQNLVNFTPKNVIADLSDMIDDFALKIGSL